jgi:hypothetical protein
VNKLFHASIKLKITDGWYILLFKTNAVNEADTLMGLNKIYLDYILECISSTTGGLKGKKMLELGDQKIVDQEIPEETGKEYFENRGIFHTSVDLNGLHGAIRINLAKPIKNLEWENFFDITTNAGTIEHVEPKKAQYECFKNVHNCLKVGGIAIHLLPDIDELEKKGLWKNHCNNYYSHDFVEMLVKKNDYELISMRMINGMICPCYQKKRKTPFMEDRQEFLKYVERKSGGTIYDGINDTIIQRIYRTPYRVARKIYRVLGIKALMIYLKDKRK